MKNIVLMLFFMLFTSISNTLIGQKINLVDPIDSTKIYKIEMQDGASFTGNVLQKGATSITMKTLSIARIEIQLSKIKSIVEIDKSNQKKDEYWFTNPNTTRYLFGPSAFNLKKGEGYYQNTYLFLNSFNVGITDNISIGGGIEIFSLLSGFRDGYNPVFIITPKVGFEVTERFHAGGGILFVHTPGFDSYRNNLGLFYGIGTYGTINHNISGGFGWGYIGGELSDVPVFTVSGTTRLSNRMALVSENWLVSDILFYSYGIRFFGEKLSVDLAFINSSETAGEFILGIPYVDFVVKF